MKNDVRFKYSISILSCFFLAWELWFRSWGFLEFSFWPCLTLLIKSGIIHFSDSLIVATKPKPPPNHSDYGLDDNDDHELVGIYLLLIYTVIFFPSIFKFVLLLSLFVCGVFALLFSVSLCSVSSHFFLFLHFRGFNFHNQSLGGKGDFSLHYVRSWSYPVSIWFYSLFFYRE